MEVDDDMPQFASKDMVDLLLDRIVDSKVVVRKSALQVIRNILMLQERMLKDKYLKVKIKKMF